MSEHKPKLIVIVGPTASGKTGLALELASKFNGEIVAADSRTIYQEMDIGTAKPSLEQRLKVPYYLIDILPPDQMFTVAEFKKEALKCISKIIRHYRIPLLVGGTGLYISSIVDNLDIPHVPPDKKLRSRLEKQIIKHGLDYLWKKLVKIDPDAAGFVQRQNPRRIIRALEVCLKTKKPFSELRKRGKPLFNCLQLAFKIPRKELLQKINQRTDEMIKNGLVEEVRNLVKKYPAYLPSLNTIGYQEIIAYLKNLPLTKPILLVDNFSSKKFFNLQNKCLVRGGPSLEEAVKLIKKNTYQYARRQITWFKKDKDIKWINSREEAEKLVKEFLF